MSGPILVISHTHDVHALEVLRRLGQRGADAVLFDTGRIPRETRLAITHDPAAGWGACALVDGRTIDLASVRAVWWRRPQPFSIDAGIEGAEDRHFALAETHATVSGLWALLDAQWMNEPDRDERAARKAWQLRLAREAGLSIPRTCITNDPEQAKAFIEAAPSEVIYKVFTATEQTWRETRVVRAPEREHLDSVRYAPVIFQDFVAAVADLRVTIVGEHIYAGKIVGGPDAFAYDFRMTMDQAQITPHEIPPETAEGLRRLMHSLGLVYGAIDLRLTEGGEYVFLEVNPAGQWLFVEQQTQQPITDAVADTLIELSLNAAG